MSLVINIYDRSYPVAQPVEEKKKVWSAALDECLNSDSEDINDDEVLSRKVEQKMRCNEHIAASALVEKAVKEQNK